MPCWCATTTSKQLRHITSSVAAGFGRHGTLSPASNPDLWPFDLDRQKTMLIAPFPTDRGIIPFPTVETSLRVASKVGNLPSKSALARPLGSRIIHYVRDRQTFRQTKATLIAPLCLKKLGNLLKACTSMSRFIFIYTKVQRTVQTASHRLTLRCCHFLTFTYHTLQCTHYDQTWTTAVFATFAEFSSKLVHTFAVQPPDGRRP